MKFKRFQNFRILPQNFFLCGKIFLLTFALESQLVTIICGQPIFKGQLMLG